jgi:hypothetical protein
MVPATGTVNIPAIMPTITSIELTKENNGKRSRRNGGKVAATNKLPIENSFSTSNHS